MKYEVSEQLLQSVAQYMNQRPYGEVKEFFKMLEDISHVKEIKEESNKDDK